MTYATDRHVVNLLRLQAYLDRAEQGLLALGDMQVPAVDVIQDLAVVQVLLEDAMRSMEAVSAEAALGEAISHCH